jgi:hypothetical protein
VPYSRSSTAQHAAKETKNAGGLQTGVQTCLQQEELRLGAGGVEAAVEGELPKVCRIPQHLAARVHTLQAPYQPDLHSRHSQNCQAIA